ncbi:MAG: GNAT family N-acetyltransferase [Deltaproteobacteria bacterium]|nr:GNAT family N-acetyltransferase [Deltaproteobacteria bacterium]
MDENNTEFMEFMKDRIPGMVDNIKIERFRETDTLLVSELIRRNMGRFDQTEAVLVATFRRLSALTHSYLREGCALFVAKMLDHSRGVDALVACAGLGPLHGLPVSEGIGEIRDLVVNESLRGRGIGSRLLYRCIDEAKELGYRRLYLETSQNMVKAKKLFVRSGFRPVAEVPGQDLPCYFLMENLQEH